MIYVFAKVRIKRCVTFAVSVHHKPLSIIGGDIVNSVGHCPPEVSAVLDRVFYN